jgi:hypothetical protein
MLGLANAISGTATIVDRKYSAYFDGTGDYIDTGITGQSTIRADFSWSLWVKPTDGQPGSDVDILGAENSSGEDKIYIRLATTGKIWLIHESNNDDATYQTASAVFPNGACDWTHLFVSVNYTNGGADTVYKIFVNGYEVNGTLTDAVSEANHELYTSDISFFIGGRNNNGSVANAFVGYIDEVAFYNVQTSAATVESIYNSGRPFDLRNDLNSYNTKAHLIFYYKMFDGLFDDRVNGIVHDQDGPAGYGAEMVTNGTFDSASGWTLDTGEAGWAISGGTLTHTDDASTSDYAYADHLAHTDFTEGAVYKIEFDSIETHNVLLYIKGTTSINQSCAAGHHVFYTTAGSSTSVGIRLAANNSAANGSIDNLSVKKLNGFPGIASGNTTFNTSTPHTQAMSSVATFDGTGDYLAVANAYQSIIRNSFTWSFWMKPNDGQPATQQSLLGSHKTGDTDYFRIDLHTDGKIKVHHAANSSGVAQTTDSAVYADKGDEWKHICVTVTENTSGNTSHVIYVDGSVEASTASATLSDTNHNLYAGVDPFYIGGMNKDGTLTYPYIGYIDEVALWNVALDADAVAAIHTAGRSYNLTADTGNYDNSSSLQDYWRMNLETKGSNIYRGHTDVIHDTPGGARGENLISNGDFETAGDSETDATGWTPTTIYTHNERSTEYAFKGTHSWKYSSGREITVNGATSGSTTAVFDDVTGVMAGMFLRTVSSGSLSGTSAHNEITNVNTATKTLTFAGAQTLANDAKVTINDTNEGVNHDISGGVEAGKTYELSFWCLVVQPHTFGSSSSYVANNWVNTSAGNFANIESGNNYGGGGSTGFGVWNHHTTYYYCHTTDTSITLRLGNGGISIPVTYYFDDIQLREVTGNPAIPVANATTIRQPV